MYGVFEPGHYFQSSLLGLDVVLAEKSIVLWHKNDSPNWHFINEKDSSIYFVGDIHNLHDILDDYHESQDDCWNLFEANRRNQLLHILPEINGSFFIAIYERQDDRLWIINDRYGSIKCFYAFINGRIYFFPHLHYFHKLEFKSTIDQHFMADFLAFGYIAGEHTTLAQVSLVPPGTVLEVSREGLNFHRYWNWHFDENGGIQTSMEEGRHHLGDLWLKAVERRIKSKSHIIIPLSGGLDSRAILAAALSSKSAEEITTVTFGMPGTLDYEIGQSVAKKAGTRHLSMDLTKPRRYREEYIRQTVESDGLAEIAYQVFISEWEKLSDFSNDILIGFMGDPIMGSHLFEEYLSNQPDSAEDDKAASQLILKKQQQNDLALVSSLLGIDEDVCCEMLLQIIEQGNESNKHRILSNYCEYWDFQNRQVKYTMQHVLKLREDFNIGLPFLDKDLVDYMLEVPFNWRLNQQLYKQMLVEKFPMLFSLPTKSLQGLPLFPSRPSLIKRHIMDSLRRNVERWSLGYLPAMRSHRERGRVEELNYLDFCTMLRKDLSFRSLCEDMLSVLRDRNMVNGDYMMSLLADHISGKADNARLLLMLVSLAFTMEVFC